MLHKYVSNLDSVLEALDVHENSVSVLTVLGVKATGQKPPDIPAVQYHTAIATQINDFVTTVSEEELRGLVELCKLITQYSKVKFYLSFSIVLQCIM